jgi:hypothetical protein
VGLTTLTPLRAECHEIRDPQPAGTLRACPGFALLFKVSQLNVSTAKNFVHDSILSVFDTHSEVQNIIISFGVYDH